MRSLWNEEKLRAVFDSYLDLAHVVNSTFSHVYFQIISTAIKVCHIISRITFRWLLKFEFEFLLIFVFLFNLKQLVFVLYLVTTFLPILVENSRYRSIDNYQPSLVEDHQSASGNHELNHYQRIERHAERIVEQECKCDDRSVLLKIYFALFVVQYIHLQLKINLKQIFKSNAFSN